MITKYQNLTELLVDDLFFICVHAIALKPQEFDMADVENYRYSNLLDGNGKLKYSREFEYN